jgi:hypothetical protein
VQVKLAHRDMKRSDTARIARGAALHEADLDDERYDAPEARRDSTCCCLSMTHADEELPAYTARYATRPIAPLLAGVALGGALGAPFVIAAHSRTSTTPFSMRCSATSVSVRRRAERSDPWAGHRTDASPTPAGSTLTT